jgi:hypothetical protein
MKSVLRLMTFGTMSLTMVSGANAADLCHGFIPANTMQIPVGTTMSLNPSTLAAGGITEAQFNKVMDRMEKLFSADVKKAGGTLQINRLWTDPTVNASAEQIGKVWHLNMYGGLARHKATNFEGMAIVACHELGHHLGGAPKYVTFGTPDWATNEGGADYYSTLKCARRFFAEDDNASIIASASIDPMARARCDTQFTDQNDQLLCKRSLIGTLSVSTLLGDLSGDKKAPQFTTPDLSVVKTTYDPHPETQCRMDTYFAGATCKVDVSVQNSDSDYRQGACVQGNDQFGWRPRCWFAPGSSEALAPSQNSGNVYF